MGSNQVLKVFEESDRPLTIKEVMSYSGKSYSYTCGVVQPLYRAGYLKRTYRVGHEGHKYYRSDKAMIIPVDLQQPSKLSNDGTPDKEVLISVCRFMASKIWEPKVIDTYRALPLAIADMLDPDIKNPDYTVLKQFVKYLNDALNISGEVLRRNNLELEDAKELAVQIRQFYLEEDLK